MKKLIILILASLILAISVNALECTIKQSCSVGENSLSLSFYQETDSHLKNINSNGPYKLCCPNSYEVNVFGSSCNSGIFLKYYNSGTTPLDTHVSKPESTLYTSNICFKFNSGSGNVQCSTKSSCDSDELGVLSLAQSEDSHAGSFSSYNNKVCCKITKCPENFDWSETSSSCQPAFPVCFVRDIPTNTVEPDYSCQSRWMTPLNQGGNYWKDALDEDDNCFKPNNGQACCFESVYDNKEYGQQEEILMKYITVE